MMRSMVRTMSDVIVTSLTPKCESRAWRKDSARKSAATRAIVSSNSRRAIANTHQTVSVPISAESPRLM
jgi:hypothetical protein